MAPSIVKNFIIPVSDTQAYRHSGTSVVMLAMKEVARIMVPYILREHHQANVEGRYHGSS